MRVMLTSCGLETKQIDEAFLPLLIELLQKAMIQMNGMNTLRMLLRCSTIQSHW